MKRKINYPKFPCIHPSRPGFTLVEVLVVVAIIGLLAALLLPAINSVRTKGKRTVIKTEMVNLAIAIEDFKSKIGAGRYPPDGTNAADLAQFLQGAWPRCPASNYPTGLTSTTCSLTPDVALVFWLGGAQDSTGTCIGFSANPQNPFDNSASRISPSYDFPRVNNTARFNQNGSLMQPSGGISWNLYQFLPVNCPIGTAPYLYFKAVAASYTTKTFTIPVITPAQTTLPYADATSGSPPAAFVNPKTYQLLCPGLDGKYGNYTGTTLGSCPLYPTGTNYDQNNGMDDMTNFTNGTIVGDDAS